MQSSEFSSDLKDTGCSRAFFVMQQVADYWIDRQLLQLYNNGYRSSLSGCNSLNLVHQNTKIHTFTGWNDYVQDKFD